MSQRRTGRDKIIALIIFLGLAFTGCGSFVQGTLPVAPETNLPGPTSAQETVQTPPGPSATLLPAHSLRIWLPPEFDPKGNSPQAEILRNHLDLFITINPGIQMDVRVKNEQGTGGLLDSLETTSMAAPLALPDLILLPRSLFETAALKGYLKQVDNLSSLSNSAEWYSYAHELSELQGSIFGLPFAGDALLMVFQAEDTLRAPKTWEDVINLGKIMSFPAADPQALFTLTQYQASGGFIQDTQGRPQLDEAILAEVLGFYQQAQAAGTIPFWITQYETDDQIWDVWLTHQSQFNITWATRLLQQPFPDQQLATLPTGSGEAFTLATGWVWAVASPTEQRQELAMRLLEHLGEPEFLGKWTSAAGYLPPRLDSFTFWSDAQPGEIAQTLCLSARLVPATDILSTLSPVLRQAVFSVLRQQGDPLDAARQAAQTLAPP